MTRTSPHPSSRWSQAGLLCLLTTGFLVGAATPKGLNEPAPQAKVEKSKAEKVEASLRLAKLTLDAKEYDLAIEQSQLALEVDPKNIPAQQLLAAALVQDGQAEKALEVLNALAVSLPQDKWVPKTRGRVLLALGKKQEALEVYEVACAMSDADVEHHYWAAAILDAQRKGGDLTVVPRQKAHLVKFLEPNSDRNPKQVDDAQRMKLEIDYGSLGTQFWQARTAYDRAYQVGGEASIAEMASAEQVLAEILVARPDFEPAHALLGMCLASVKSKHYDLGKAIEELKRAPGDAKACFALGRAYRDLDKVVAATGAFEQALVLDPQFTEARYQLGVAYKLLGRPKQATEALSKVIEQDSYSPAAAMAATELQVLDPANTLVAPTNRLVADLSGPLVFNTDKARTQIREWEENELRGVIQGDDMVWLEKILRRILSANELTARVPLHVKLVGSEDINAFAVPWGDIYVTQAFLNQVKLTWPNMPLDENNSCMAGVLAHELVHILRNHSVNQKSYFSALEEAGVQLNQKGATLTTRQGEIEADREGMLYMLAAGYNPNAMIEFMERFAVDLGEPPPSEDHPTWEERISYLLEFWTNDIRYAWQSFEFGTTSLTRAAEVEWKDLEAAQESYDSAIQALSRCASYFKRSKETWNNLGLAQAKYGLILQKGENPLSIYYTTLAIERSLAQKLPEVGARARGKNEDTVYLERAQDSLQKALAIDANYGRALINLTLTQIALKRLDAAGKTLLRVKPGMVDAELLVTASAILSSEQGKLDQAILQFTEACKVSGDNPKTLFCLAIALAKKGDKDQARLKLGEFLTKEPQDSPWAAIARLALEPPKAP